MTALRNTTRLALLCALLLLMAAPATAAAPGPAATKVASIDVASIDAYIEAQMHKHGLPGVALAIVQGEQALYLRGYGSAGRGRPMTPQTPMVIGSQTKSFTALAVAQLAERGLVDVRAPVRDYIPWFAVADADASARITVAHLLHHTSGLSDAGHPAILPEDASIEAGVRALASARLTAPVGERFQYFNAGYGVLAHIVERVSGQSYTEYIQEHILDPLRMTRTYTDPALAARNGLAQGYTRFFGVPIPARQPFPAHDLAAGYLISTAEDLARFAIAMNHDGVYQGTRVLSSAGMAQLFRPVLGYGLGWFVADGHIYHGGANETFKTFVDLYPQRDLGIVLLVNQGYLVDHYVSANQLFAGVEALVLGEGAADAAAGPSTRVIGWGVLAVALALAALQVRGIARLRGWRARSRAWSPARRAWDVAAHFVVPTAILLLVYTQVKGLLGDRFNLGSQLVVMWRTLTDITLLMIVSSVPDYAQGVIKAAWAAADGARRRRPL